MKRFYKQVAVAPATDGAVPPGFGITLDGRPVRTPAKQPLRVPRRALAEAIASEWSLQGEKIDPQSMPLTQLANTALDRMPMIRATALDEILGYGDTDLICYRTTDPPELVARQSRRWDPLLDWAATRFGVRPMTTTGFAALDQPPALHGALRAAVEPLDDFRLAALHLATAVAGSILLGLALTEAEVDAETAYEAAMVDDIHQLDRWGEDREARLRLDRIRRDLDAAALFVALHDGP